MLCLAAESLQEQINNLVYHVIHPNNFYVEEFLRKLMKYEFIIKQN